VDDNDIIRRVQAGDGEAFSLLVEKYHRHLLNFIFRILREESSVEDIGQEVFLSVYKSLETFDERRGTPFSAWLFISARNRCVSELRKRRDKANMPIDEVPGLRDRSKTAEEMLIEREREHLLAASLEQLEEPYRGSLLLSLRGDSIEEIAARQQISVGTVKSRLFRAREKIRQFLRHHLGGTGYERI